MRHFEWCSNWRIAARLAVLVVVIVPAARAADGQALFADNCASCHGMDGKARTPAGKKVHAKDLSLSKLTNAEIERQIKEGRKDSRGVFTMPPFKEKLSDEDTSALIPVVKRFRK